MALDLRGCGIGNIVLEAACHAYDCAVRGVPAVIVHDDPSELGIMDLDYFVVTPDASYADPTLNPKYCCLGAYFSEEVRRSMQDIVRPRVLPVDMTGVEAGFCFRISIPDLDGDVEFMNDAAVDRMIREMKKYSKVFACSNCEDLLRRVAASHPDVVTIGSDDFSARNADDHALQWHALAACPIVYHGVRGGCDGNVKTSTFAPVAAAYGQRCRGERPIIPVGINNRGELRAGHLGPDRYGW
jgi:hypothetical protein